MRLMDGIPPADLQDTGERRAGLDARLAPLLAAKDEGAARPVLEDLLGRLAAPLVGDIVTSQLGRRTSEADRQDVQSGALVRLAEQLRALQAGTADPIADFDGYVAVTAFNACHAFLRRRFPELTRLRSRLRYLLTHDAALGLWPGHGRTSLCGLAEWRGAPAGSSEPLQALRGRCAPVPPAELPRFVRNLVKQLGRPCRFDDLAELLADMMGVSDAPPVQARADSGAPHPVEALADPAPTHERRLEWREYLARLWSEIRLLPQRQRVALLMNLRDDSGQGVLSLFPLTGVAGLEALAETLEISQEVLAGLWQELPKDDHWIAQHLGLTRRQVINLRKCARERLGRRLGAA